MIDLMDVHTMATMAGEYVADENCNAKAKCSEIVDMLTKRMADRKAVLDALQAKAEASGSDNSWNRYESADEAYGYAEQLYELLHSFVNDWEDWDDMGWQLDDIADSTRREFGYRLERSQW